MKISVIIPTYNSKRSLERALDSVFAQTFKDFETIVVDDGSADATESMVRVNYPEATLLQQANSGVSKARNCGVEIASGDYLAFLDADDAWREDKLALQYAQFMSKPELAMVFTDNDVIDKDGNYRCLYRKRERLMEGDLVRNIFSNSGVCTSTVMVRRSVFLNEGGFNESLITAEDDDLWIRIAARYPVTLLEQPLVKYTLSEGSLSRTPDYIFKGVSQYLRLIETREDYADIRERLNGLIAKKWSRLHFSNGWYHMNNKRLTLARERFLQASHFDPSNHKAKIYYLITLLPLPLLNLLRKAKRSASR